ncbi:KPN_02809 family neutral zinc metallopeptidase [Allosphingosinicella indica]|uniref:Zinc metalloprotease n=1 Tax=Allosphingosinicella indica TaxID=941907 RepID=A0A1X7GF02_9SPHN|nr:neutral zinc metallopeptidase [Allosphingosinicella indica]SMF68835.1 hypothetical protein SAMN06295910_1661 [Allosphingosinicella indica]
MKLDDYRSSDNVGDQRGMSFGGGGGGGMGMLLGLVGSKFGIGGILVVVVLAMLFGFNPFGGGTPTRQVAQSGKSAAEACAVNPESRFSCQVLASTEDTWGTIFQENGQTYRPAGLIFYDRNGQSGCGAAQSAMGPFYCPNDNRIYLDTSFFAELQNRFGAAGDFAQAYVIAHEVGHHIQQITGTLDQAQTAQARAGQAEGNEVQVRVELQADCYAGVWAARNRERLEAGDVEEGMRAAEAIGDDTLQKAAQGYAVPESFTHGTSAQRMAWLRRGLESGNPNTCDTFSGNI